MAAPQVPLTPLERQGHWQFANSLALLVLRLMLGIVFIHAGAGKLFGIWGGFGMAGWTHAMEMMQMPVVDASRRWNSGGYGGRDGDDAA